MSKAEYLKQWYKDNPGKQAAYTRKARALYPERDKQNRARQVKRAKELLMEKYAIIAAAKQQPCMDCGVQYHSFVMDFDHRPGEIKEFTIGQFRGAWSRLRAEIAKCDVVCSNCHRIRTLQRGRGGVYETQDS